MSLSKKKKKKKKKQIKLLIKCTNDISLLYYFILYSEHGICHEKFLNITLAELVEYLPR